MSRPPKSLGAVPAFVTDPAPRRRSEYRPRHDYQDAEAKAVKAALAEPRPPGGPTHRCFYCLRWRCWRPLSLCADCLAWLEAARVGMPDDVEESEPRWVVPVKYRRGKKPSRRKSE